MEEFERRVSKRAKLSGNMSSPSEITYMSTAFEPTSLQTQNTAPQTISVHSSFERLPLSNISNGIYVLVFIY